MLTPETHAASQEISVERDTARANLEKKVLTSKRMLVDDIMRKTKIGHTTEEIWKAVIGRGWSEADTNEAFATAASRTPENIDGETKQPLTPEKRAAIQANLSRILSESEAEKAKKEIAEKERDAEILSNIAEEGKIEAELAKMSMEERKEITLGLRNMGFFVSAWTNKGMAAICKSALSVDTDANGKPIPFEKQGTTKRFFASLYDSYKKDELVARKQIEETEKSSGVMNKVQNYGGLAGNILKWGRNIADVAGAAWAAGSPLRYVMMGAQGWSKVFEVAKETRLLNEEVADKTREADIEKAADEAWRFYNQAKEKAGGGEVSGELLEKAYLEKLPADLLERLKKTDKTLSFGLQWILKKDIELAIKLSGGVTTEAAFAKQLKEYDRLLSRYGEVDALAMGAKYMETAGKAVIAGVQIETIALLFRNLPDIMSKLASSWGTSISSISAPSMYPDMPRKPELRWMNDNLPPTSVSPLGSTSQQLDLLREMENEFRNPQYNSLSNDQPLTSVELEVGARLETFQEEKTESANTQRLATINPEKPVYPTTGNDGYNGPKQEHVVLKTEATLGTPQEIKFNVKEGDTLWGGIKSELGKNDAFSKLEVGQQTYVIDALKDKFAVMSEEDKKLMGFRGLGTNGKIDINIIYPGQKIDLSMVLSDSKLLTGSLDSAEKLSTEQIAKIEDYVNEKHAVIPQTDKADLINVQFEGNKSVEKTPVVAPEQVTTPKEILTKDPEVVAEAKIKVHADIIRILGSVDSSHLNGPSGFSEKPVSEIMKAQPSAGFWSNLFKSGIENYSATEKIKIYIDQTINETGTTPIVTPGKDGKEENFLAFVQRATEIAIVARENKNRRDGNY